MTARYRTVIEAAARLPAALVRCLRVLCLSVLCLVVLCLVAAPWLQPAAWAGDDRQVRRLADQALQAYGESRFEEAASFYARAARSGDVNAQYNAAAIRLRHQTRQPSARQAFDWLRSSARAGYPPAPQDYAIAARWYERAAEAGDVAAQYMIASMYESGTGVKPDLDQALHWYTAAARQGDVAARGQARALTERIARERAS